MKPTKNHVSELYNKYFGWRVKLQKAFWPSAFAALGVFWVRGGNFDQLWMQRWAVVLISLAGVLAYKIGKNISWGFAPLTFTTLFSGIVPAYWFNRYDVGFVKNILSATNQAIDKDNIWAVQSVARQDTSRACFTFLLLFVVLRSFHRDTLGRLRMALGVCGIICAINIVMLAAAGGRADYWVPYFDNPSMGACFIVLSLFAIDANLAIQLHTFGRVAVWAVGLAAVLLTKTSAPLLALAAGGFAYLVSQWTVAEEFQSEKLRARYGRFIYLAPVLVAVVFVVGYMLQGSQLWNNNSRFNMWTWFFEFWDRQDLFTHIFGFGTGSSRTFMPLAEVEHGMETGWYFWLHNDWLQILFEQGVAGFVALIIAAGTLVYKARYTPCAMAFLFAFGAIMLVNFPLHWPVHALLLAAVIAPATQLKPLKLPRR